MRHEIIFEFIKNGNFSKNSIEKIKKKLLLTDKQFLRLVFKALNSLLAKVASYRNYIPLIRNCCNLIYILFTDFNLQEEEVEINKIRLNKTKMAIVANANKLNSDDLRYCANKLDQIMLDKYLNTEDLKKLVISLIDKKEDINIIKQFTNNYKGSLIASDLFNYVFFKAIDSLINNDCDIYYFIALLKLFYTPNIDRDKYVRILNLTSNDQNEFANEIYFILYGMKKALKKEDIIKKYGIVEDLKPFNIKSSKENNDDILFTIDDDATILRDDALSIKKDGNKFIIGIHIADVGKYLDPKSEIDIQALNNYKCLYLPNKGIRILPTNLEERLSLNEDNIRDIISLYVVLSDSGEIIDYYLKENSELINKNLSYKQVDDIINFNLKSELDYKLRDLYYLSCAIGRGNNKEAYWVNKNKLKENYFTLTSKGERIVSEFMILYGYLLANIANDNKFPYVYRIQNKSYLNDLAKDLNIDVDSSTQAMINSIYLPSKYSKTPGYHNGLNLNMYSHSTDALRRYPDTYNQYLLHKFYFKDKKFDFNQEDFDFLVDYFNQRNMELNLMRYEYIKSKKPN